MLSTTKNQHGEGWLVANMSDDQNDQIFLLRRIK